MATESEQLPHCAGHAGYVPTCEACAGALRRPITPSVEPPSVRSTAWVEEAEAALTHLQKALADRRYIYNAFYHHLADAEIRVQMALDCKPAASSTAAMSSEGGRIK